MARPRAPPPFPANFRVAAAGKDVHMVLQVEELAVDLVTPAGSIRAVDDVSFAVRAGQTVALVGESGCGKTLTALGVMRLLPPAARIGRGRLLLKHEGGTADLAALPERALRAFRGNRIAMVFQEPMTALNPVMRVADQIAEPIVIHQRVSWKAARARAVELLGAVGVPAPAERARGYPHELSGGLRQRALIAMALACEPDLLIADEPTTALDVTVQSQIMLLLKSLQKDTGMGLLLITHDLGIVAETCDHVHVMYGGRIVESAPVLDLFAAPRHPYTGGLLSSIPSRSPVGSALKTIPGQVPPLGHLPSGCRFRDRCPSADDACRQDIPLVQDALLRLRCIHPLTPKKNVVGAGATP